MPREQINIPKRRVVGTLPPDEGKPLGNYYIGWAVDDKPLEPGEHFEESPILWLGWGGTPPLEASMQFSMQVDADEVLRAAGEILASREKSDVVGMLPIGAYTFHTIVLQRSEAQAAIRALKRARDHVFEADE